MVKLTPEKRVQNAVISTLRRNGWLVQRNQQGLGHTPGRPDLEATRQGVTIWIECKSPRGRLSPAQEQYIRRLAEHGATVMVVSDSEQFLVGLEQLQEALWPGMNLRRLC